MIYDLIKNYNVTVVWSINPNKDKDGTDFTFNGVDYRGGTFIIPAQYRTTTVNARITHWVGQGVVGVTTNAPVTVPLYRELKGAAPRWTLDQANGSIAVPYFTNAAIPATAYGGSSSSGWKVPANLGVCDDIFVLPHSDPIWSTHQNLVTWNLTHKGGIWAACHGVSALESMVNPNNRSQQANFLSIKDPLYTGTSGNYTLGNSLTLTSQHNDGSPPYSYRLHSDPVAQFMGNLDAATQNGAEQVFIPRQGRATNPLTFGADAIARWNPGAKIIVYDPTQVDVTNPNLTDFRNIGALVVYGNGYDDPDRGPVMYMAGHQLSRASLPPNIAGQRAFFNFSFMATQDRTPQIAPIMSTLPDTLRSLSQYQVSMTFPSGVNPADYTIQWSTSCAGSFTPNATQTAVTYIPPVVSSATQCIIYVTITDGCGRQFYSSQGVTIMPCELNVSPNVTNVRCFGESNGRVEMTVTGDPGPFSWSWTRVSPAGNGNGTGTVINNLPFGTYNITITNNVACTTTFVQPITQPGLLSVTKTVNSFQCFGSTGSINLNPVGGRLPYTYAWTGPNGFTANTRDIANLLPGFYEVTLTDDNGCVIVTNGTILGPTAPLSVQLDNSSNSGCFGVNDGVINLIVTGGTPGYGYLWDDGTTTLNRSGLSPGTYTLTVTDANGCVETFSHSIVQPSRLTLTRSKIDPTCPPEATPPLGINGEIDLVVNGGTPPYSYFWSTLDGSGLVQGVQDQTGLTAGIYTVLVTDANGCTAQTNTILINQNPMPPQPSEINNN